MHKKKVGITHLLELTCIATGIYPEGTAPTLRTCL